MRIESLHLIAFGKFDGRVLDLSGGKQGLHIVYGANEAGKSTSLRALRQALYGIPAKSADNFKHAHSELRVGAVLKKSSGETLRLVRRKGNSKTLRKLESENELLDETLLKSFLGNLSQQSFEQIFGIDHQALVAGGRSITSGSGELGQILFAAAAGIGDLRSMLASLEKDYQELYVRGGSTRIINKRLAEYAEAKKILRESELPNSEWEKHDTALKQALMRKEALDKELMLLQNDTARLKRMSQAIPLIAERNLYMSELARLAEVRLLPDSFEDESRALLEQLHILRREEELAKAKLKELKLEIGLLNPSQEVLSNAVSIEALQQKLGSHQKAQSDRITLERELLEEEARARICLQDLGRADDFGLAANLRMSVQEKTRLRKLALEKRALWQAYSDAQSLSQLTDLRLKQTKESLARLDKTIDSDRLAACLKDIQQDAQIEERAALERKKLEREFKQIMLELRKLQLSDASFEQIEPGQVERLQKYLHGLAIPDLQTIESYERSLGQLGKEIDLAQSRKDEAQDLLRDLESRLQELDQKLAVPTESDLDQLRSLRDRGWSLVLRSWKELDLEETEIEQYLAELNTTKDLAAAFEFQMSRSDIVADRLRHEAEQVALKVQLSSQAQRQAADCRDSICRLEDLGEKQVQLLASWDELWIGLSRRKLSPASARNFLSFFEALLKRIEDFQCAFDEMLELSERAQKAKAELNLALAQFNLSASEANPSLLSLLEQGQKCLERAKSIKQKEAELEKELSRLKQDLSSYNASEKTRKSELESWAAIWHPAVESLGLGPTTSPEELTAFLDRLEQFFSHFDQLANYKRRIAAISRDAAEFKSEVELAARRACLSSTASLGPEELVLDLHKALSSARELAQKKTILQKQLDEIEQESRRRCQALLTIEDRLQLMLAEAGIDRVQDLPQASRKSQEKRRLESLLEGYDRQLARLAEDSLLEDFISDCRTCRSEELDLQVQDLELRASEKLKEKEELQILIGSEKQIISAMDGSALAADAAVHLQQILSELGQDFEQWCRLKIASVLLSKAIERYRRKNQSPILKRASDYFARLSAGSFSGLYEDYDEKGEPVLFGQRAEGRSLVPIDGMSEGSCDQLYLAIRLAALSLYLEKNEAIPFIVDDILVNFDDRRASAALQVFAEFSGSTQVIMFTHHKHLVELARAELAGPSLFFHDLEDLPAEQKNGGEKEEFSPSAATFPQAQSAQLS